MLRSRLPVLVLALVAVPGVARAESGAPGMAPAPGGSRGEAPAAAPPGRQPTQFRLANDDPTFLAVELGSTAALAVALTLVGGSAPTECGWCGTNALDVSIRNAIYLNDSRTPALASHIVSLGAAPLLALGAVVVPALGTEHPSYAIADAVKIVNAFALTQGFSSFSKNLSARERPAFHYGREAETEFSGAPKERYRSFFSGDTAWAFTIGAAGATVAYERGYWTAPYAAVGGAVFGVATGTLRMASDVHWFTDVLTGAAVGTSVGVAVPLLLHRRKDTAASSVSVVPVMTPAFAGAVASGTF